MVLLRRLLPIIILILATSVALVWFNRVELKEKYFSEEEKAEVAAVSFEEVTKVSEVAKVSEESEKEVVEEVEEVEIVEGDARKGVSRAELDVDADSLPAVTPTETELPDELNLAVPWTPQAPFANWDEVHEETCEEASIYMVHLFFEGEPAGLVDPAMVDAVLLDMVEEEKEKFGYWENTTAEETAEFAESYYGYETELIIDPTVDDIKEQLALGYPVIVPLAGQVLANPYFTPPGPDYHMLLIKGYTSTGFITNDPGTRRGENWVYEYDHFMNSIHDWNGGDVLNGQKVVIVLKK